MTTMPGPRAGRPGGNPEAFQINKKKKKCCVLCPVEIKISFLLSSTVFPYIPHIDLLFEGLPANGDWQWAQL